MGHTLWKLLSTKRNILISIVMRSFVLLSSLLAIAASQGWGPRPFEPSIPVIEKFKFGTFEDQKTFRCDIAGCKWAEATVHADWMFYGAGSENIYANNPEACAASCALDVNCGSFEYDISPLGVPYCSWWKLDKCNTPMTDASQKSFATCAKVDFVEPVPVPAVNGSVPAAAESARSPMDGFAKDLFETLSN